ncbi:hypothetical protein P8452_71663 [Trifolium repens]|nr:hypothetical protein P8452_71663 [Trifolium repens]
MELLALRSSLKSNCSQIACFPIPIACFSSSSSNNCWLSIPITLILNLILLSRRFCLRMLQLVRYDFNTYPYFGDFRQCLTHSSSFRYVCDIVKSYILFDRKQ